MAYDAAMAQQLRDMALEDGALSARISSNCRNHLYNICAAVLMGGTISSPPAPPHPPAPCNVVDFPYNVVDLPYKLVDLPYNLVYRHYDLVALLYNLVDFPYNLVDHP